MVFKPRTVVHDSILPRAFYSKRELSESWEVNKFRGEYYVDLDIPKVRDALLGSIL